ncbi:MAG: hypothetical protein ACT6Q8_24290 [Niveispirillum sp.]|uniref:hypothetical protein n=1 Tax=Niveispirillum sp. TaxID=1917217 RepID=UPI00403757B4
MILRPGTLFALRAIADGATPPDPDPVAAILLETGELILLENGQAIVLEISDPADPPPVEDSILTETDLPFLTEAGVTIILE